MSGTRTPDQAQTVPDGPSAAFQALLDAARDRRNLPPVHTWHPERVGDIDIRIAADGRWFHEGTEIKRQRLVALFATVLRRDDDGHCLVTPVEKLRIVVEDAPFLAIDMESDGGGRSRRLLFTTNVGDHVLADAAHPIEVEDRAGEPRPYVTVRNGLRARMTRSVFYRLVDLGTSVGGELEVWSADNRFVLGRIDSEGTGLSRPVLSSSTAEGRSRAFGLHDLGTGGDKPRPYMFG